MSDEKDRLYLEEMLEALDRLAIEVGHRPAEEWIEDQSRVAATSMYLIVLGEGAQNLSSSLKHRAPDVPWADIAGLRNRLAHGYLRADRKIIWEAAALHSPMLKDALAALLSSLESERD